jgi:hypothetical protein
LTARSSNNKEYGTAPLLMQSGAIFKIFYFTSQKDLIYLSFYDTMLKNVGCFRFTYRITAAK